MATVKCDFRCDLTKPIKVEYLDGNIFTMDNGGNTINVYCYEGEEPATLGGSVSANVIRPDGTTVPVSGAIDGNKAYVTLQQAAYAVPGHVTIIIKVTQDTTVTTIAAIVANNMLSSTDTIVDPGTIIPSVQALIAQIETAVGSIPADYSALLATLAADYSSSKTYAVGDYAWQAGVLKRCIVPITTAETYTAAHWTNAVLGDDLSALKSALNEDMNAVDSVFDNDLHRNLVDPSTVVVGEIVNQTNGVFSANANHTRTNYIEVKPSTTYSIALKDDSIEYIRYAFYNSSHTYISGALVSVSTDLHYLLTTTSETKYIAISAPNAYFPIMLIESSVRVLYRAYGVVVDTVKTSFIPTITPAMTDFFIIPNNLVNPDDVVAGEYVNQQNGNFASNPAHSRTTYIPVTPGGKYCIAFQSNIDTIPVRYAWYNSSKSYREGDMKTIATFGGILSAPTSASYLVISALTSYYPVMIQASETKIDYIQYDRVDPVFPDKYIDDNTLRNKYYQQYKGSAQSYTLGVTNSIKKNKVINFGCDFETFGTLNFSLTDAGGGVQNKFAIDDTNVTRTVNGTQQTPVAHGLTITNHINVTIEVDIADIKLTVVSEGSAYNATYTYNSGRIVASYSVASMTISNVDFSWTCKDFRKNIWCYGDSYFSYGDNRWIYYLTADGYADNVLLDAYAGENSESSIDSLISYITIAQPKMIVWCLGMNDGGDSGGTPSGMWKTAIDILLNICNTFNIIPVLATIPTVPTINHEAKNAWVRASGYQYIDFAKAVGADSSGNWFTGMLSQDGVHPTVAGAMALYRQAITDCPQLMID